MLTFGGIMVLCGLSSEAAYARAKELTPYFPHFQDPKSPPSKSAPLFWIASSAPDNSPPCWTSIGMGSQLGPYGLPGVCLTIVDGDDYAALQQIQADEQPARQKRDEWRHRPSKQYGTDRVNTFL